MRIRFRITYYFNQYLEYNINSLFAYKFYKKISVKIIFATNNKFTIIILEQLDTLKLNKRRTWNNPPQIISITNLRIVTPIIKLK